MPLSHELFDEATASLAERGYTMKDYIGSGSFGVVYIVKSTRYGQLFCAKILPRVEARRFSEQTFRAEFTSLLTLSHPSIVRLYDVWSTDRCNFLVLEYIPNGTIADRLRKDRGLDEATLRTFGVQILEGLAYCHDKHICHGDIKPANILIDDLGRARLADFGLSGTIAKLASDFEHIRGSVAYLPPERLTGAGTDPRATDVWALGVTFFQMATGNLPWVLTSVDAVMEQIHAGAVSYPPCVGAELRSAIGRMLDVREKGRATIREVLEMPFFAEIGAVAVVQRLPTAQTLIIPKLAALGSRSIRLGYPVHSLVIGKRRQHGSVAMQQLPPVDQLRQARISSEA
jgi:serine/threonine protein kinase